MIPAGSFGRLTDPPASLVVTGVRVIDPGRGTDEVRDLAILDGRIAPPSALPADAERVDGARLVAAPGFCDLHAHLRDPGDGVAETIATGARAAAHGGFTTVCAMPNTDPPIDDADRIAALVAGSHASSCRVRPIGAATVGRNGDAVADLASMAAAGAVAFSDDGASVRPGVLADALEILATLGLPLIEHAEDPTIAGDGVMRAGPTAVRLGLAGWSEAAEVAVVERDLAAAGRSGARIHMTHVSAEGSLAAIRRARSEGVRVTCDVTPHHLALADSWVAGDRAFAWDAPGIGSLAAAYDAACRVNPPLTTRDDAGALRAAVDDGTVDAIATDHAPHASPAKLVPFEQAAPGLVGLETALSVGLAAVQAGELRLVALIDALSMGPAAIIGESRSLEVGATADLVVFDPEARWRVTPERLASRSTNTPLLGMTLPGVVRLTVANGRVTYRG